MDESTRSRSEDNSGQESAERGAEVGCVFIWMVSWLIILVIVVTALAFYFKRSLSLVTLLVALGIALVVWLVARRVARWYVQAFPQMAAEQQRVRNEQAQQTLLRVRARQELVRPLFIYLSPFTASGSYSFSLGSMGIFVGSSKLGNPLEMEPALAKLLAPFGDLVELGQDLEALGAGRIRTGDEEWKEVVRYVCETATGILMFPSTTPGISWEMSLLRDRGYVSKTVFLMPPLVWQELSGSFSKVLSSVLNRFFADDEETREDSGGVVQFRNEHALSDWEAARSHYARYGIVLPDFEKFGMAFRINDEGKPISICPLALTSSEWQLVGNQQEQEELRNRIQRIGQTFDTDWVPVWAAVNSPGNQHLLPLLSYFAYLVERQTNTQE